MAKVVTKKKIQEFWTKNAPGLDVSSLKFSTENKEFYLDADQMRYRYDSYIVSLIDSFANKGASVLEIGCGLGTDSRYMAKRGCRITSLDLSRNSVYLTMKGMGLFGLKGKGVNADAEKLPFKDGSFDVVYSFGVLHHTPDTQKAINEVYRVLKPNGKSVIMLYHKGYPYYLLLAVYGPLRLLKIYDDDQLMSKYDNTPLSRLYSKKEIKQLFSGFKQLNTRVTTYGGIQAHPVLRHVYKILYKSRFLMRIFGSFIIIEARK